jgi:hypothetical protein
LLVVGVYDHPKKPRPFSFFHPFKPTMAKFNLGAFLVALAVGKMLYFVDGLFSSCWLVSCIVLASFLKWLGFQIHSFRFTAAAAAAAAVLI